MEIKKIIFLTLTVFLPLFAQAQSADDDTEAQDSTDVVRTSILTFPNAFSPNDDQINDTFKPKTCENIVEFHAYIFNRWGQKLFDWTDPAEGWDGKFNGSEVKEGVYFLLVKAKGADGHVCNIRKDISLLRGYTEGTSTNNR